MFVYVAPLFFASSLLLLLGGIGKLLAPANASRALSAARLPSQYIVVRALAAYEVVVGGVCLAIPTPALAALMAVTYASFAAFLIRLMGSVGPVVGCGCVGAKRETPPSRVHVILNVCASASGVVASAFSPSSFAELVSSAPVGGVGFIIGTLTVAYLAYVMALLLPSVMSTKRTKSDQMSRPVAAPTFFVTRAMD